MSRTPIRLCLLISALLVAAIGSTSAETGEGRRGSSGRLARGAGGIGLGAELAGSRGDRERAGPCCTKEARPAPKEGDAPILGLIEGFVEAYNSGDAEEMLAFYRREMTPEFLARRTDDEHRSLYKSIHGNIGRLHSREIRVEGPKVVTLEAEGEEIGETVQIRFDLEADPPHRVKGFSVEVGPPHGRKETLPPLELPGAVTRQERTARLDAYFEDLARQDLFSGVVLAVRGDRTIFEGAYGLADRGKGVAIRLDTRFDVGSITKTHTRVAIGQLAGAGKLSLDDAILKHLPDYPNEEVARKVTIRHLLEHASGLGDIFNETFRSTPKERLITPRDFFPLFAREDLLFEPGEGSFYSNAGYVVLGAILEAASGMPYDAYIQRHVFEPAGMKESGFFARDGSVANVAIGYTRGGIHGGGGELRSNVGLLPHRGCPAGSSSSSARDLLRFDRALRDGRLLGVAWTDWYFTGVEPGASAKGSAVEDPPPDRPIAVAGGAPGVNALMETSDDVVVIVLANFDPPVATEIGRNLRRVPGIWKE